MTTVDGNSPNMSEHEVPVSPLSFPNSRYPTGWFQVGWSDDVAVGEVRLVHYFGTGIVLWRGASGQLYGSDQHCLHLGGNLGVGGTVEGEDIVCPWHNWHWNGEGRNTLIPYSKQTCKPQLQLKMWDVRDWNGSVIAWYDAAGNGPSWQPPSIDGIGTDEFYPMSTDRRYVSRIKAHPQMIVENGGDPAHVMYVHGAGEMPEYRDIEVDGPLWAATVGLTYGAGKESTWLTPDGEVQLSVGMWNWGLGLGATIWPEQFMSARMLMSNTPVDDEMTDQFFWITCRRDPSKGNNGEAPPALLRFFSHQKDVNEQDYFTWANMKVLPHPNFTPEEARPMASLRRWAWQFYPNLAQPEHLGASGA